MSVVALASSQAGVFAAVKSTPAVRSSSERPTALPCVALDASFIATGLQGKDQIHAYELGNWMQADRDRNRVGKVKLN